MTTKVPDSMLVSGGAGSGLPSNIPTKNYIGRTSASTGTAEVVPVSTLASDIGFNLTGVNLGTGTSVSLNAPAHANRRANYWTGTSPATATIDSTGANPGDLIAIQNNGTASFSVTGITAAPTGFTNVLAAGTSGLFEYTQSAWRSATPTSSASGQLPIQFQDESANIGIAGAVGTVNFIGAGVTATHSSGTVSVTIPGGSAANEALLEPCFDSAATQSSFEDYTSASSSYTLPFGMGALGGGDSATTSF